MQSWHQKGQDDGNEIVESIWLTNFKSAEVKIELDNRDISETRFATVTKYAENGMCDDEEYCYLNPAAAHGLCSA